MNIKKYFIGLICCLISTPLFAEWQSSLAPPTINLNKIELIRNGQSPLPQSKKSVSKYFRSTARSISSRRVMRRVKNRRPQNIRAKIQERVQSGFHPVSQKPPTNRKQNWTLSIKQDPLPDQISNFVVPPKLIELILSKEFQKERTATSSFTGNIQHVITDPVLRSHGVKELIGIGTSNFYGSTYNRKTNIYASIKKFDGLVIPKGETFSFNETLESVEPSDGFVKELVIIGDKDEYQLGGGICQVSSTVYRSAFNTGLPIDVRRGHSKKVKYYSPHGFDATIYLGGQDFKFTNDTPGDIMLQFVIDGNNLIILTYGTKDRQVDSTQHGGWGYSYWWKRLIQKKGEEAIEETYRSYYKKPEPKK